MKKKYNEKVKQFNFGVGPTEFYEMDDVIFVINKNRYKFKKRNDFKVTPEKTVGITEEMALKIIKKLKTEGMHVKSIKQDKKDDNQRCPVDVYSIFYEFDYDKLHEARLVN